MSSSDPQTVYLQCVTNEEVTRTTTTPTATEVIRDARLRYFGRVARSSSVEDRCRQSLLLLKFVRTRNGNARPVDGEPPG